MLSRRNILATAAAGAAISVATARAASFGNPDEPAEGAVNVTNPKALTDPGPQDPGLAGTQPSFLEPPATDEEIRASALQFVRKLSGFTHPSRANEAAFDRAVDEVSDAARRLIASLSTASPAKNREAEAMKARERAKARFA